jgi:hypothetical protein
MGQANTGAPEGSLDRELVSRGYRVRHKRGRSVLLQTKRNVFTTQLTNFWKLKIFLGSTADTIEFDKEYDVMNSIVFARKIDFQSVYTLIEEYCNLYLADLAAARDTAPVKDAIVRAAAGPDAFEMITAGFVAGLENFVRVHNLAGRTFPLIQEEVAIFAGQLRLLHNRPGQAAVAHRAAHFQRRFLDIIVEALYRYNRITLHIAQERFDLLIRAENTAGNVKLELDRIVEVPTTAGSIFARLSIVVDGAMPQVAREVEAEAAIVLNRNLN